jgi:hypothetical protein
MVEFVMPTWPPSTKMNGRWWYGFVSDALAAVSRDQISELMMDALHPTSIRLSLSVEGGDAKNIFFVGGVSCAFSPTIEMFTRQAIPRLVHVPEASTYRHALGGVGANRDDCSC